MFEDHENMRADPNSEPEEQGHKHNSSMIHADQEVNEDDDGDSVSVSSACSHGSQSYVVSLDDTVQPKLPNYGTLAFRGSVETLATYAKPVDEAPAVEGPPPHPTPANQSTRRSRFLTKLQRYACLPLKHPCISFPNFRWFRLVLVYLLVSFTVLILVMWFGKLYEQAQVRHGLDTLAFYETPHVCVLEHASTNSSSNDAASTPWLVSTTYSSVEAAYNTNNGTTTTPLRHNNTIVAHCGDCGSCSNPHDVRIYDRTKNTLYLDSVKCAKAGILGGRAAVEQCLHSRVNLTDPCNNCWVDNVLCDLRKCIFSCFIHAIFNQGVRSKGNASRTLNPCTQCDEVRCGPQFVQCAGANRRRAGILSDIERDDATEVCHKVDPPEWWNDETLQHQWEVQQVPPEATNDTAHSGVAQSQPPNRLLRRAV